MPVVADILRRHPNAQIDWLVEEAFADLVRLVAGIRRVLPFAERRWRKRPFAVATWRERSLLRAQLNADHYDVVVDCQGLLKSAWVASRARGELVGLGNRTEGSSYEWPVRLIYDRCVPIARRTHVVERSRQLVAAALGDPPPQSDPAAIEFGLDTHAAAIALAASGLNLPIPYVVLVHATSRADKQWPEAAWIGLGQALVQRGVSLVLPGGAETERAASERLAHEFGAAAIVPPRLPLPAVAGLLNSAAATVGVDTGLVHLAAALKRPTVELYNFDTAWRTGAYWSPHIINLGGAADAPTLQAVKRALAGFGLL